MDVFGLQNTGSNCFLNSLYQALYYSAYRIKIKELLDYQENVHKLLSLTTFKSGSQECSFDAYIQITDKLNINDYFNLEFVVIIKCLKCGNQIKKTVIEKFFIPKKSLSELYQHSELIDDYICEKCGHNKHDKTTYLKDSNDVLCFYMLKYEGTKIPNIINISQNKYIISGFIIHYGGLDSGHYISCGLRNNKWYTFNDSQINNSITRDPKYIIFYTKY